MMWDNGLPDTQTIRAASRYDFAVPTIVELANGLFKTADRSDGLLVELSAGGAAIIIPTDERLKVKKRYRVYVDDHEGVIEIRNITALTDAQTRIGVSFFRLGLELQELVVDSLESAKRETSRLAG